MLFIDYFGETLTDAETNIPDVFEIEFRDEWMEDRRVRMMIMGIDGSTVIAPHVITHPYFGTHSHLQLSTGCKCAILSVMTDIHLDGDRMGDNCYPWVHMYSKDKDIYLTRESPAPVTNGIPVTLMNNKKIYTDAILFRFDSLEEIDIASRRREHDNNCTQR